MPRIVPSVAARRNSRTDGCGGGAGRPESAATGGGHDRQRRQPRQARAALPADPALAAPADADPRRQPDPAPLGSARARRCRPSVARSRRRIHRRSREVSDAPLQRIRHLPAIRAALSLWRSPLAAQGCPRRASGGVAHARLPARRHCRGTPDLAPYQAEDTLYRFGRAYPAGWDEQGEGLHCMHRVEWLGHDGAVLAFSDAEQREKFLAFVCRHRAPCIGAHWAFLLKPLVLDHAEEKGPIRYRQIEYYRMPLMGYLALDNPRALTRADFIRLGLVTAAGGDDTLPFSDRHVAGFEERYCFDRFWSDGIEALSTRYMCCGHAL